MRYRSWAAFALVVAAWTAGPPREAGAESPATTTVYVVRHAESEAKTAESRDPPLTEFGMAQAAELRDGLAGTPIRAVYSTSYRRTLMTAGPSAGAAGLTTTRYKPMSPPNEGGLPTRAALMTEHAGESVLVVGHSNTVPRIVAALGGDGAFTIDEDEFDNLVVLQLTGDATTTRRHRYGPLKAATGITVSGKVAGDGESGDGNVSGIALIHGRTYVCADEGTRVQEWRRDEDGFHTVAGVALPAADGIDELDLEGLAASEHFLYAVGSYSLRRKGVGDGRSYDDNRRRLAGVEHGGRDERDRLFRIPLDDAGALQVDAVVALDLRDLLAADPFLGPSTSVPSKENGLDIEAIALDGKEILLGLRGPVLRGNLTPIVRLRPSKKFKKVKQHRVVFVDLEGRGVRGLTRCRTGFLVLSGPVGDGPTSFRLHHWDGGDMLPGERHADDDGGRAPGRLTLLGTVPASAGVKAEGLAVVEETENSYRVLIVFDGPADGAPTAFDVRKLPGL